MAIGVPPMLLGIPGDNTYANYAEANRAFWRQTVLPLVNPMSRALGGWLGPAWGGDLRLAADLDQVEALSPEREALWARVVGSRTNVAGLVTVGERRAGSFSSLESANKLINSTLSQNADDVDKFVAGSFPSILPFKYVHADFDSPTGREAYAPNHRSQPHIRPTFGVTVYVVRDGSERGYRVHSAWPTNRD